MPAMGYVGEHLTLAGGGDYGDETVSEPILTNIICIISKKFSVILWVIIREHLSTSGGDIAW